MHILLVGDVYGRLGELRELCLRAMLGLDRSDCWKVVQLGDLGVGFPKVQWPEMPPNLAFLRGNHDSPHVARSLHGYLGDFGFIEGWGESWRPEPLGLFFLSGAWSIDQSLRTEGVNWWPEEELSARQLEEAFDLYCQTKPRLVLTHDCPPCAFEAMPDDGKLLGGKAIPTRTTQALGAMFEAHQPELWVFGHHHVSWKGVVDGTRFRCLNVLESAVLDTQSLAWQTE